VTPAVIRALVLGLALVTSAGGVAAQPLPKPAAAAPAPAPARPTAPEPVPPARPPAPIPEAIPVAEIATRAAQVPSVLRTLTEAIAPDAEIDSIRARLPQLRQQMDLELLAADSILRSLPTLDMIQAQQQVWQQRQLRANQWLTLLTHQATLLQLSLNRLTELEQTWRETREAALAAKVPEPTMAQIDGVLAAIRAAAASLTKQRTAVLDLQSVVAEQVSRSETVLARFRAAQQSAVGGILIRDVPPLWQAKGWAGAGDAFATRFVESVTHWTEVTHYFRDPSRGWLLHAAIFVVLAAVFWAARRSIRREGAAGHEPREVMAFDRPYAAALAIALLFASSPISAVPPTLRSLFEVLALVPVFRLTLPVLDPRLVPMAYAVAVLFVLDSVRQGFGGVPVIEQVILGVEMLGGLGALGYSLASGELRRPTVESTQTERLRSYRAGAFLVMLVLALALVTGAAGYMRLARLAGAGVLGSGALALSLYAVVRVATGLVTFALQSWPIGLLRGVQHHREFLVRRVSRILTWAAVLGWAARSLAYVGLLQPAITVGGTLLTAKLGRGSITFSLGDVLEFVGTIWVAYLVSSFIRFVLQEDIYPRTTLTRGMSYALSSLLNYIVLTLGFLLAIGAVGMDLTKMTVLAGAFGVGLGFGMQSIVNNFVSGLILLFERPIHVGDVIEVGDLVGEVTRIGIRASVVRTYLGAEIIVPNAQLATERVINWTLSDRRRRIDLAVGVDYRSAPEKVVEVLESVARAHPSILKDPAPQAVFMKFDESSIAFELRAWTAQFERWPRIQTELAAGVYAALHAAGMSLPFPQREIRVLDEGRP
jgi:small-conductance mechanosensitive channel